jgi:hypothetical protein
VAFVMAKPLEGKAGSAGVATEGRCARPDRKSFAFHGSELQGFADCLGWLGALCRLSDASEVLDYNRGASCIGEFLVCPLIGDGLLANTS